MSLPVAARGEKAYLRDAWSASDFDFEHACRAFGRNDAFWVLCYRRHLDGEPLPDEKERNRLVRDANRATGGLDRHGERERYTRHEAQATVEQVELYQGGGTRPLLARRRAYRGKLSPAARRLLVALCDVALVSRRDVFCHSHRSLAAMIDVDRSRIAALLRELEDAKQVFRRGFTKARDGQSSGTSRFTLYPPRPIQNIDEREPPIYDALRARWVWSSPLAKGSISYKRWRWLAMGAQRASAAASVPNVSLGLSTTEEKRPSDAFSCFCGAGSSPRGSP